ncbi:hypothetical protein OG21DRAFT_1527533 [Imleria badia]|nr:hypothetical protein OG21DRAFT_1527533 [Imleria badia]
MAKHRIVYESEDEENDVQAWVKKSRTVTDQALLPETTKWSSKIDIATQGEDVNPMAPSFQGVGEHSRQSSSDGAAVSQTHRQPTSAQSHSQPWLEFLQAAKNNTRAPPRNWYSGLSSQTSAKGSASKLPSSCSSSLFSSGTLGTTPATSHAPSVCSSTGERHLVGQHEVVPPSYVSRVSSEDNLPDPAPVHNPVRLQWTASFYDVPLSMNMAGHSLSAGPNLYGTEEPPIDENSPSDDDSIAEAALHQREGSSGTAIHNNSRSARSLLDDDEHGTSAQIDNEAPLQMHSQPRDDTAATCCASVRQQQAGSVANDTTPQAVNGGGVQNRPTDLPLGQAIERAEPWQLQYYDPLTFCASFNSKAIEYIDEAIVERRDRSLVISKGWWPHHALGITRLLWEDLGNWRSWDPENWRERNIEIAKGLLGSGGLFMRDGYDNKGHINNLAHPALLGLIINFFYTSPASVGKLFPEVFSTEVLRVTVAIAAMVLKVVLDEVAAGQGEVNFRVNTYLPVYSEILSLMNKCDTNDIHCAKTKVLRKRWAGLGSNGMAPEPAAAFCKHMVSSVAICELVFYDGLVPLS